MNLSKPLINLAILETLKSNDFRDEIDLFVPYVAISVGRLKKIPFTSGDLKNQLKVDFAIDSPLAAVEVLMARAKKRELIRVENHVFFPVTENLKPWQDQYDIGVEHVDESVGLIAQEFVRFTEEKYKKNISTDDAIDLIYEFLKDNIGDSALISTKKSAAISENIKNSKHLTASFIASLHASNSHLWPSFEIVTRAIMLASYLGYANQISTKKDYSKISVYIDTPIIMGLLGYSGENKAKTVLEMINLLRSFNVDLVVFDITLRELEGILGAWKNDLQARNYQRFNPKTLELLRHQKIDFAALETHLTLLEKNIESNGIRIQRGFKINERFNCDVGALEEKIKNEFKGKGVDPRHDADVLNRILSSRRGGRVKTLNQEFSIFITPNVVLVDIGKEFFGDLDRSIPYVATDRWITTMFWFKHPEIFKDLPTRMLVASAYGTMFSDNGFWRKFTERMESLQKNNFISDDDFVLVRYDADLLLRVHELSVDRGIEFSDTDIFDIVAHVKNKHTAEKDQQIASITSASAVAMEFLSSQIFDEKQINSRINSNLKKISKNIAATLAIFLGLFLSCCVFLAAYASLPEKIFPEIANQELQQEAMVFLAILIMIIVGFAGTFAGLSMLDICRYFYRRCYKKIFTTLSGG